MNPNELVIGGLLAFVLLGVAGFFGWRQIQNSQSLRTNRDLPAEERTFVRKQIRRRLVCCVLMALLALLLVGWYAIESQWPERLPHHPQEKARDNPWVEVFFAYWAFFFFVLFSILALAGVDLIATARFGLRSHRRLEAERRAVLEAEAARFRKKRAERNGD